MGESCMARREIDEMVCFRCRLRWAMQDEKPPCRPFQPNRSGLWCEICGVGNDAFKLNHAPDCPNYKVHR